MEVSGEATKDVKKRGEGEGSGSNGSPADGDAAKLKPEIFKIPVRFFYAKRPFTRYNEIVRLADEPITFQSMTNRTLYYQIMLAENPAAVLERAKLHWKKWFVKIGKGMMEESQATCLDWWYVRECLNVIVQYTSDAFGLTGDMRLMISRFVLHLFRVLKNERVMNWVDIVKRELRIWEMKPNANPGALKAAAHLMLKFMSDLYQI